MKKVLIYILTSMAVTGITTFSVASIPPSSPSESIPPSSSEEIQMTFSQKMLSKIIDAGSMDLDVNFTISNNDVDYQIKLEGAVSYVDLSNIKMEGNLYINIEDFKFEAQINYLDNYLYLATDFMKAKINTSKFLEGLNKTLPLFNVSLPKLDLEELDFNALLDEFSLIDFSLDEIYQHGEFSLNEDLTIDLYADDNYELKEIKINDSKLSNNLKINASIETTLNSQQKFLSPETSEVIYDDFTTITSLVDNVYFLSQQKQFSLNFDLSLFNKEEEIIDLNGHTAIDLDNSKFNFDLNLLQNEQTFSANAYLDFEQGIYFQLNNLFKGHLSIQNITDIKTIIESYLETDLLTYLQDKVNEIFDTTDIKNNLKNFSINDYVSTFDSVSYKNDSIILSLDLSNLFSTNCSLTLSLTNSDLSVSKIEISNFVYNDYHGTLSIDVQDFKEMPEINSDEYQEYEPLLTIYDEIKLLSNQDKFAFNINLPIINNDKEYLIKGFIQFALNQTSPESEETYNTGYVDLTVDDQTNIHHLILDFRDQNFYLSYNDKLYGELKLSTLQNMLNQIKEFINNEDPLLSKITNLIPKAEDLGVISQIINGNYSSISLDLIKSFIVDSFSTNLVLDKSLLNLNEDLDITISYNENKLTSLDIKNINYNGLQCSLEASLDSYQEELHLSNELDYLDLNTLEILLKYGIPTLEQEYYQLSGEVNISLFKDSIPLEVKIHNNQGKPEILINLTKIPVIAGVNKLKAGIKSKEKPNYTTSDLLPSTETDTRSAHICIKDGYTYIERTEKAIFYKEKSIIQKTTELFTCAAKVETSEFLNNIFYYLFSTVLGFTDSMMNKITNDLNVPPVEEMHFDELITSLAYSENDSNLKIGLNLAAILGNDSIKNTVVNIKHAEDHLSEFSIQMNIINIINLNGSLVMEEYGLPFNEPFIENYINNYLYGEGNYISHS